MSLKSQSKGLPKSVNFKTSASNLFLNITIIVLVLIVGFLAYSLFAKIKAGSEIENIQKQKGTAMIQVEVLNGCGVTGVADKFTDFLRKQHFDVVQEGNYRSFDVDNTLVIDRTGNLQVAEKVAEALGVNKKNVIQQVDKDYLLDVSVVIGRDFNSLNPMK